MAEKAFKVVVAASAQRRYRKTILVYLIEHFPLKRVIEIEDRLGVEIKSLASSPLRGRLESDYPDPKKTCRFILFRETRILELKILYVVDQSLRQVSVTDLFPTRMNPSKIGKIKK